MECRNGKSILSSKAYQLFVQELAAHLAAAGPSFSCDRVASSQELRQLSSRFHTIKGGAGFFGLDQIQKLAGELEDSLHAQTPSCLKTEAALCATFEALKSASADLPDPMK